MDGRDQGELVNAILGARSVYATALVSSQWVDQTCASSNRLIGWLCQLDTLRGAASHSLFLTQGNDRIDERGAARWNKRGQACHRQ